MKKALLVVSFGTSHAETRKRTIEAIEQDLRAAFPEREAGEGDVRQAAKEAAHHEHPGYSPPLQ